MSDNFNATEMYKIASKAELENQAQEYTTITKEIEKEAIRGSFSLKRTIVYSSTIARLRQAGFFVEKVISNNNNYREFLYEIKWDNY